MARIEMETFHIIADKREVYNTLFGAEELLETQETLLTDIFNAMFSERSIAYDINNFFRSIGVDDFNSEIYEVVDWHCNGNEWSFTVERMN